VSKWRLFSSSSTGETEKSTTAMLF
jgi:hypothetical protein